MKASQRANSIPESPFRMFLPYAEAARARGLDIIHLNIGDPDLPAPESAIHVFRHYKADHLPYASSYGFVQLRKAFVDVHSPDHNLSPDDAIITCGASEGLYMTMLGCLEAGDEMIVFEPFYANYRGFAMMAGINLVPITTNIENNFALPSTSELEKKITPRTKAILITNPSNPTGQVFSSRELTDLAKVVKKYGLFLIADEVYGPFAYDLPYISVLNIPGIEDHAIALNSISKRSSSCGARIGAVISRNKSVINAVSLMAKLRLSVPYLEQFYAVEALHDPVHLGNLKRQYDQRRTYVYDRLKKMPGVTAYLPQGAFYGFTSLPIDDDMKFCKWLLESFNYKNHTIILAPGSSFYTTPGLGKQEVRLAYVQPMEKLALAMDCLENALSEYQATVLNKELELQALSK